MAPTLTPATGLGAYCAWLTLLSGYRLATQPSSNQTDIAPISNTTDGSELIPPPWIDLVASPDDLQWFWKEVDLDGSGSLSQEEILEFMKNSPDRAGAIISACLFTELLFGLLVYWLCQRKPIKPVVEQSPPSCAESGGTRASGSVEPLPSNEAHDDTEIALTAPHVSSQPPLPPPKTNTYVREEEAALRTAKLAKEEATWTEQREVEKVKVDFTLDGVDYAELRKDASLERQLVDSLKEALVSKSSGKFTRDDIVVELSHGSVKVSCTIAVRAGNTEELVSTMADGSSALREEILASVRSLPGIKTLAKGLLSVSPPQVAARSSGKLKASFTISLQKGLAAADFKAEIGALSESLQQELVAQATSVPGLTTVLCGAPAISDMQTEVEEPCRDTSLKVYDKDAGKTDGLLGNLILESGRFVPDGFMGELPLKEAGKGFPGIPKLSIAPLPAAWTERKMSFGKSLVLTMSNFLEWRKCAGNQGDIVHLKGFSEGMTADFKQVVLNELASCSMIAWDGEPPDDTSFTALVLDFLRGGSKRRAFAFTFSKGISDLQNDWGEVSQGCGSRITMVSVEASRDSELLGLKEEFDNKPIQSLPDDSWESYKLGLMALKATGANRVIAVGGSTTVGMQAEATLQHGLPWTILAVSRGQKEQEPSIMDWACQHKDPNVRYIRGIDPHEADGYAGDAPPAEANGYAGDTPLAVEETHRQEAQHREAEEAHTREAEVYKKQEEEEEQEDAHRQEEEQADRREFEEQQACNSELDEEETHLAASNTEQAGKARQSTNNSMPQEFPHRPSVATWCTIQPLRQFIRDADLHEPPTVNVPVGLQNAVVVSMDKEQSHGHGGHASDHVRDHRHSCTTTATIEKLSQVGRESDGEVSGHDSEHSPATIGRLNQGGEESDDEVSGHDSDYGLGERSLHCVTTATIERLSQGGEESDDEMSGHDSDYGLGERSLHCETTATIERLNQGGEETDGEVSGHDSDFGLGKHSPTTATTERLSQGGEESDGEVSGHDSDYGLGEHSPNCEKPATTERLNQGGEESDDELSGHDSDYGLSDRQLTTFAQVPNLVIDAFEAVSV